MSRIRTVKPELFRHEELYEAEKETGLPLRVAFIGLFTVADREGRFKWRPRSLKLDVLPHDELDFSAVLAALVASGLVVRYEVDGEQYGYIPTFAKHQVINQREARSSLPEPFPLDGTATHMHAHASHSTGHVRAHGEGKGKEGKGKEEEEEGNGHTSGSLLDEPLPLSLTACEAQQTHGDTTHVVFEHWQKVMDSPRSKLDKKRWTLIKTALAMGYSGDDLCKAIDGCRKSPFHMGENERRATYNGLDLILRNAERIDAFMAMDDNPPVSRMQAPTIHDQRAHTIAVLTGQHKGASDDFIDL